MSDNGSNPNDIGSIGVSLVEANFLAQLLEQVNPQGIQGTEVKLGLMKKVDAILKAQQSESEES